MRVIRTREVVLALLLFIVWFAKLGIGRYLYGGALVHVPFFTTRSG